MLDTKFSIAVIGLGYVGLPLACEFGKKYETLGYDINSIRVDALQEGVDSTLEVSSEELQASEYLKFSNVASDLKQCNTYILTVPTPIDRHKKPDLEPLKSASKLIGSVITKGDIVIYESTVFPGCTEEECIPVIEAESGLVFGKDFFAGYSPERINPGDKEHRVSDILKVTSGSDEKTADIVDKLYASVITAGTYNTLTVGFGGGDLNTNTAVGSIALDLNTTGIYNTAIGRQALLNNTIGISNTATGHLALSGNTEGDSNTAMGRQSLSENTTGGSNSGFGYRSLQKNIDGNHNTGLGLQSLQFNTSGLSNTAAGSSALQNNTTSSLNSAVGRQALFNTNAGNNSGVGYRALYSNSTGVRNTAVGCQAGFYIEGDDNTILGAYEGTAADSTLNDTVIISAGTTERARCDSSGTWQFTGKLVSASTVFGDGGTTLTTKDYVDSAAYAGIPQNAQTSAYTLVSTDNGQHISITTGGVTVPSAVFSVGDTISIYNNSAADQTITQGASVTLRFAGTVNTGNRTLAQRGLATVLCVGSDEFVISGGGLS